MLNSRVFGSTDCALPLCIGYQSMHLGQISKVSNVAGQHGMAWALGATRTEEYEVLGVWHSYAWHERTDSTMVSALKRRGLTRVDVVVDGLSGSSSLAAAQALAGASVVDSHYRLRARCRALVAPAGQAAIEHALAEVWLAETFEAAGAAIVALEVGAARQFPAVALHCRTALDRSRAFWDLPQQARFAVVRGEALAERLQAGVSAALRRHGRFQSAEAAAAFAENWLRAAERRFALDAVSVQRQRRAVAADVLGAAA